MSPVFWGYNFSILLAQTISFLEHQTNMTISIIKQNDDVFIVKVTNDVSTSYTVTFTDQSLAELTNNNVTMEKI